MRGFQILIYLLISLNDVFANEEITNQLHKYYQLEDEVQVLKYHSKTNSYKKNKLIVKEGELKKLRKKLDLISLDYQISNIDQINNMSGRYFSNIDCYPSASGLKFNEEFDQWLEQADEEKKKVAFHAEQNPYIKQCLKDVAEGTVKEDNSSWSAICKKVDWWPDTYQRGTKSHRVKKKNGRIVLETSLYFTFKGEEEDREESFKKLQSAKSCMKQFYAKQGIDLEITFYEESGFKDWYSCDHTANLHKTTDRANSDNWSSHGASNPNMNDSNRCALYVHELNHKLGLGDTYVDPDCPDRDPINPTDDIMNAGSHSRIEDKRLYPDALKKILGVLCGK